MGLVGGWEVGVDGWVGGDGGGDGGNSYAEFLGNVRLTICIL